MTTSADETTVFQPKFGPDGLLPAIAVDHITGEVLMLAYMNELALTRTIETGDVHYWSRSRGELWQKGATSGNRQELIEARIDCDQDALLLLVEQKGPACHTGRRSCFYRSLTSVNGNDDNFTGRIELTFIENN